MEEPLQLFSAIDAALASLEAGNIRLLKKQFEEIKTHFGWFQVETGILDRTAFDLGFDCRMLIQRWDQESTGEYVIEFKQKVKDCVNGIRQYVDTVLARSAVHATVADEHV